jgi:hypothetical protein
MVNKHTTIKFSSEIETEMQVELAQLDGRHRCILVGVVQSDSLIFRTNDKALNEALANLPENSPLTIRGISRGEAFGFNCQFQCFLDKPQPLFIVSFPDRVQHQTIRNSRRVKCLLPATFARGTTGIGGVIVDISNSGCHFQTIGQINNHQAEIIQLDAEIMVSFELPGKEVPKTIEAVIRNTFVEDDTVHVGIQFNQVDTITLKLLNEFIALSFEISPF